MPLYLGLYGWPAFLDDSWGCDSGSFNYAAIMKARRRNQRGKAQKRRR